MTNLKIGASKKKLPTKLVGLIVGVIAVVGLGYLSVGLVWDNSFEETVGENVVTVKDKNTAYEGEGVNKNDAAAAEAYCEDTKERINITGSSRIIDTCVAKSVSNEWLSKMTSDEIEQMYNEQPSCIETGFDDEGYSCFTGYNEEGCNKGGQRADGTYCEGSEPATPVDLLSGYDSTQICGLVASCQAEAEFSPEGFNKFGCDRQGRNKSGELCPYEHITRIYNGDGNYDQLGFSPAGFNKNNCDIRGFSPEGLQCSGEDVTRVYGLDKKDQFGFFEDGYNDKNCDISGVNRQGEACAIEDISRIFDPKTNRDQFGLDPDGFNEKNCHFSGFNRQGELCAESDITRIVGKSGKDQRGIFASGQNEFGCLATGLKRNGEVCSADEIPKVYNPLTGKNSLGFFASGFNEAGCSATGYNASGELCGLDDITRVFDPKTNRDQFDLDREGFNSFNCGVDGYRANGELCSYDEMPLIIDLATGLNQFGLDSEGFSPSGCSITGFNRQGERCDPKDIPRLFKNGSQYDQFGIGADGFNAANCNIKGLDRNGNVCALKDIPRVFDPETGTDQFGLLPDGFTVAGCSLEGKRRDGTLCELEETPRIFGQDGFDQNRINKLGEKSTTDGITTPGVDLQPNSRNSRLLDTSNLDVDALKRLGFIDGVYNKNNCDINGLNRQGELCSLSDITRVYDKETGRDQFGLDPAGFNKFNCNLQGLRPDGSVCPENEITRLYDKSDTDQLGKSAAQNPVVSAIYKARNLSSSLSADAKKALNLDSDGFSVETGCDLSGVRRDGTLCDFDDIPKVFDPITNRDQFGFSPSGFNKFNCDINGKKPDGSACRSEEITEIMDASGKNQFGEYVDGLPKNNSLYGLNSTDGISVADSIKKIAESKAKLESSNIKNKAALNALTASKMRELGLDAELFNKKGCGIDGLDRNGNVCDINDIPRIFDPLTNRDQFGFSEAGYNSMGCDFYGFRDDGSRCAIEDITQIKGKNNQTQFTSPLVSDIDSVLNTSQQRSLAAIKSKGGLVNAKAIDYLTPELIEALGLDENLRNARGCGLDGLREDGSMCDVVNIPRVYDPVTGLDQFGINRSGFNSFGCDLSGKRADGSICPPEQVTRIFDNKDNDQFGQKVAPEDSLRKALSGLSGNIKNIGVIASLTDEEIAALGLDEYFRNAKGCGLDGLRVDGSLCALEDIPRVFDPDTGLDQFGLTRGNRNKFGCDLDGKKSDGTLCSESEITRLLDINNIDSNGRKIATLADTKAYVANRPSNITNPSVFDLLTSEKITELGLDENMRNGKGCGLDGLRADGSICALEDIPRVFDPETGLDQFGLTADNRNIWGCGFDGLDRDGNRCDDDKVTRIFGSNGLDQRGLDKNNLTASGLTIDGRNSFGCDISGNKEDGTECESWEKIEAFGVDGYNSNNINRNGEDRFKLINGRNSFGCDINGLREDGSLCPLDEISRFFQNDGTDQFGLRRNNRNEFGCGLDGKKEDGTLCELENIPRMFDAKGIDQLGLTAEGFTDALCSIEGLRPDGSICSLSEIPRLFGDDNYDQFGIGADGFNAKNCNLQGLNRQGERCPLEDIPMIFGADGLSQLGITRDGFAANGCSITGVNRQGLRCEADDIPRLYNALGEDQFNVFADGYNAANCDIYGFNREGGLCEQSSIPRVVVNGVDQLNFAADGFNPETGCNLENKDKFGNSCHPKFAVKILGANGKDQFGLIDGYNQYGCDLEGRGKDGRLCDISEITTVIDPKTGRDQFGIDQNTGLSVSECGLDGRKPDGTLCSPEDMPRMTDALGTDQYGLNDGGFSVETGCNLLGVDRDGNQCIPDDVPFVIGGDGLTHLGVNAQGKSPDGYNILGLDDQGCNRDNRRPNGEHCAKYVDLNIDVPDTERLIELRKLQKASLALYTGVKPTDIGQGSITAGEITYGTPVATRQVSAVSPNAAVIPVSPSQLADNNVNSGGANGIIEIPEGTTMHVYVETPVNSDYTTTVWGEIIGGELDGAKVRGTIEVPYINDPVMPRDKFKYVFNTMIKDRKTYTISAVSMTYEDLGEFVEADNVDYHRIQRYGGLLTAAAFQALGASYLDSAEERALTQQSALTQQATATLLGQNTRANAKENLSIATDQIADLAKQNFFRRPTIEKDATDLMIIFMEPVDNDELPAVFTEIR